MSRWKHTALAAALVVVAGVACDDPTSPEDVEGTWGAENVQLIIAPGLATFETPCLAGNLTIPFDYGDDGRWETTALLNQQGGAGGSGTVLATLRGRVSGDRMSLSVSPASVGLGPYDLQRGLQVQIIGCP
jgi:hypothetical protein